MFGIGWTELIVIALVVLIFVGPRNLPPLLRKVGGIMAELKAASRELRNQIDAEVQDLDLNPKQMVKEIEEDMLKAASEPYEEMRRAEREIRQDLEGTEAEFKGELRQAETEYKSDLKKAITGKGPYEPPPISQEDEADEPGEKPASSSPKKEGES